MAGATGWFQAHPLARAFLRIELETNGGKDVSDLHHRAACWFAGEGRWSSAVEHALLDPHDTCLLELVGQVGLEPLLRSTPKGQRFAAAVARTAPARWPLGRPLALAVAVLANVDGQAAYGVSEPLRRTTFPDAADERLRVVAVARIWRNLARNDLAAAVLREAPWEGATADELLLLRSEEVLSGHDGASYDVIARQAAEVLAQAEVCEADRIVFHLRVVLAALALIEGEPLRALAHLDAADLLGARFGQDLAIPLAEARVIRAAAVLDLGQQDGMGWANLAPLASAARAGPVHLRLAATGLDIRQRWREGDDPRGLLRQISDVLTDVDLEAADPGFVFLIVELEMLLAESVQDLPRAESAVKRLPASYRDLPEAASLRAHLHRMRRLYGQARRELLPVTRGGAAALWPAMRLRILVLDGILAGLQGSSDTASLQEAVEIAIASGRRRPFLELGADALGVLRAHRHLLPSDAGFVDGIIDELQGMAAASPAEPLTQAEVKVLRWLASVATLQEIADGMHLSRNTIKTHTSSIYRKLGVRTRREAVGRGRELGLLRPDVAALT